MPVRPFDGPQFVPTQWDTAADKAAFGNTYLQFIESGWNRNLFTKKFYQRLSNCFGHIARTMWSVRLCEVSIALAHQSRLILDFVGSELSP
jgi:hypothetical protein